MDQVIQRINRWQQWSQKMGLRENPSKTQVTAKTFRDFELLLGKASCWAKPEIKTLGVTTTVRSRTNSDSENTRLSEAMQRARALFSLPLGWEQRVRAYQSLVLSNSKASYGWIGHNPLLNQGDKLFSLLTTSLNQQRIGSRELKKNSLGCQLFSPLFLSPVDMPGLLVTFFDLIPPNGSPRPFVLFPF